MFGHVFAVAALGMIGAILMVVQGMCIVLFVEKRGTSIYTQMKKEYESVKEVM
jgi:hypothetical protein